jgi:hypothetical protein
MMFLGRRAVLAHYEEGEESYVYHFQLITK